MAPAPFIRASRSTLDVDALSHIATAVAKSAPKETNRGSDGLNFGFKGPNIFFSNTLTF